MLFLEMLNAALVAKTTATSSWVFALVQILNTMAQVP
jgi:hypothetical protein